MIKRIVYILVVVLAIQITCVSVFAEEVKSINELGPSFGWIDDDGKQAVYTKLFPWAQENNIPITSAVISGSLGDSGYITADQMKEMYDSGVVEIASHTQNHKNLSLMSERSVEYELTESKAIIESYGIGVNSIVYPGGSITDDGIKIASKYYDFGFVAGGPVNSTGMHIGNRVNYPPISTYRITRISIDSNMSDTEIDFIKQQIDEACENNGLVVFMSHIGSTGGASGGASSDADLEIYTEIADYIDSKGYGFEHISTILDRFRNSIEVGMWSGEKPENYFVVGADATVKTDGMNGHVIAEKEKYTNSTRPSEYPQNQITSCYISSARYRNEMPEKSNGVLTAYLIGGSGYRLWMPAISNRMYIQIKTSSTDQWKAWVDISENYLNKLSNDAITHKTTPIELKNGINISIVADAENLDELPGDGTLGYLTSYKISSYAANAREEWQPFNDVVKYVRIAKNSYEWGPWYKFEPVLAE